MAKPGSRNVAPLVLFGAFDRHNLGDLLFAHLLARALAPAPCRFAGLVARDLRPWGGHRVHAIRDLAARTIPAAVLHVGGELLDCDAWEAAVMTQPPAVAATTIARLDADPPARARWAAQQLGMADLAPYLLSPTRFRSPVPLLYQAVGGVALAQRDAAFRGEVLGKLGAADYLSVRDVVTRDYLAGEGITAALVPDSAVLTAELFAGVIHRHGQQGTIARLRRSLPGGYVAVQFSAEFGDDACLDLLAAQLGSLARQRQLGLVLFRAGAAPWHDDLAVYHRLLERLEGVTVCLFEGVWLWDLVALLAGARLFCGSSLHGRILATAFGIPGVSLVPDPGRMNKQRAYLQTWHPGHERVVGPSALTEALEAALDDDAVEPRLARQLAQQARVGLQALAGHLTGLD